MRLITITSFFLVFFISTLLLTSSTSANNLNICRISDTLSKEAIIKQLGWVQTGQNRCGGYYLEAPFSYPQLLLDNNALQITSDQLLFAQHGTSVGQGKVTISRFGQQIIANKAYLYRDPATGKLRAIELINHVTLREPNSLVVAASGQFDLVTKTGSLNDILYRSAIYSTKIKPAPPCNEELQQYRKVTQLSAWGQASYFRQDKPNIFEFDQASYSTCPPSLCVWQVKAKHIVLNKNTGRGTATHARVLVGGIPVAYVPYLNFPIDSRRKTGFLWPTAGNDSRSGIYATAPFYWNLAPNYDMTITPAYLAKRGLKVTDLFRYLTPQSVGNVNVELLPHDRAFATFQQVSDAKFQSSTDPVTLSELRRLEEASTFRKSFNWQNATRFNEHWSDSIDYNWVSDDYYLRDFSNNLNQVTKNQLLQQGEINYKNQYWNFIGRVQGYQTLHPVDEMVQFNNQYTRSPQLALTGDFPNNPGGFDYFIMNDFTHFDIANNPGSDMKFPMGNRLHVQPGISRSFNWTYLTVMPRFQFAMTQYKVGDVDNAVSKSPSRTLPIFDINTGLFFDRSIRLFRHPYRQTLEPQVYYVFIPFRDQSQIPVFDTTVNTLTYDQVFMYNRFSGLDRFNNANQIAAGLTTRFIDQKTGTEKIKAAIGELFYFQHRLVTLCNSTNDPLCQNIQNPLEVPNNPNNKDTLSPLTGLLNYAIDPNWSANANTIWNPKTSSVDNQSMGLHYQPPGTLKIINLGYNFVRGGDILPSDNPNSSGSNLSSTDISFNWPFLRDWSAVGRWTQNWNHHHFQNLLYGLQYDSCCWAVRFVTGRAFTNINLTNTFQYTTQFYIQLALKGLGSVPITGGDPSLLLGNSITGYQSNFGQDF